MSPQLVANPEMKTITSNTTRIFIVALIVTLITIVLSHPTFSQSFTSTAAGSWTSGANWGGTAPPTSGQTYGTINVNHNITLTGNYSMSGADVNIAATKTLTITGNVTISGGANINVSGTLNISLDVFLNAKLNILPGGKVNVSGNVTVYNSTYLIVGTSLAPPSYADLVIKKDLISISSGDVLVDKNGRMAVFGNFTSDTSGGSKLTINSGGQVYFDKNISMTGGSDKIINNNGATPIGFYTNGTVSATGGGASIDPNRGTKATMQTNDPLFYSWVTSQPLPIKLVSFKVASVTGLGIELNWTTVSELNFDKFIVQRSVDGVSFESIGEVKGTNNSKSIINYFFEDQNPLSGKVYYRLNSVDLDGTSETSTVVFAESVSTKEVTIYPNPSTGESINFKTNFQTTADDQITVMDFNGSVIASIPANGNNNIVFNTTLKAGVYIVKYSSEGFNKTERLIVK